MSDAFWLLMLIPIAVVIGARLYYKRQMHLLELGGMLLASAIIIFGGLATSFNSQTGNRLILNGEVRSKAQERTSCSHSYSCNCRTVDNQRKCDTCYEHPWDYDWNVSTTVGGYTIDRVDRRGTKEPPRWTSVAIGEPVSRSEHFTNYLLAARNSLFADLVPRSTGPTFSVPGYPSPYDYYRINRVVETHSGLADAKAWNAALNNALRKLGPSSQVNIVLVLTKHDREFGPFLERAWAGGKKNDVVIVLGSKAGPTIDWVHVFTFARSSGNERFVVDLREYLRTTKLDDVDASVATMSKMISLQFRRKQMSDFKYIADEIAPGVVAIVLIVILLCACLAALTHVFSRNDLKSNF